MSGQSLNAAQVKALSEYAAAACRAAPNCWVFCKPRLANWPVQLLNPRVVWLLFSRLSQRKHLLRHSRILVSL